jgi:hypothetical protein
MQDRKAEERTWQASPARSQLQSLLLEASHSEAPQQLIQRTILVAAVVVAIAVWTGIILATMAIFD